MQKFIKNLPTIFGILFLISLSLYKFLGFIGWHYLGGFDRVYPTNLFSYFNSLSKSEKVNFMDIYSCKIFVNHALNFQNKVDQYRSKDNISIMMKDGISLRGGGETMEESLEQEFRNLSAEGAGCAKKYRDSYIQSNDIPSFNEKMSRKE